MLKVLKMIVKSALCSSSVRRLHVENYCDSRSHFREELLSSISNPLESCCGTLIYSLVLRPLLALDISQIISSILMRCICAINLSP